MASDDIMTIGWPLIVIGACLILVVIRNYILIQKIQNIPTSKVRSVAIGLVELFGNVKSDQVLKSPITQTECMYWRIDAYYISRGSHKIYSLNSSNQLFLEDETGRIKVDLSDAKIDHLPPYLSSDGYLDLPYVSPTKTGKEALLNLSKNGLDPKVTAYLEANPGEKDKFKWNLKDEILIQEYVVTEDDPIYILGSAQMLEGANSDVQNENLIIRKGKSDNTMYISNSSEKKILGNLSASIWWMFGLGIILFGIGLFLLLNFFGL